MITAPKTKQTSKSKYPGNLTKDEVNISGGVIVGQKRSQASETNYSKKSLKEEGYKTIQELALGNKHYEMKVENVYRDYL